MKLRNLMYATMIACAFASCSKDDDPVVTPDGGNAEANATLEVRVGRAETKALPGTDAAEDNLNNLSLLVFNGTSATATLEAIGTEAGEAGAGKAVKTESIKPGNKNVVVLANIDLSKTTPVVKVGMSYAEFLTAQLTFTNEKATTAEGFTMNSKVYPVTVIASKINYMGYNEDASSNSETKEYLQGDAKPVIKLYRNVAKIVLNTVALGTVNPDQYPGAKLTLKEVFVLHGHTKTTIVGENAAQWGPINVTGAYLNGASNTLYADTWVKYMQTPVDGKTLTPVYNFITASTYAQEDSYLPRTLSGASFTYNERNIAPFYVYENTESTATNGTDYCTLLVVKADFTYNKVGGGTQTETDRYYPVAVGYNAAGAANTTDFSILTRSDDFKGLRSGVTPAGVLRNLQYLVNLKITGPGYKTPFGPKPDGGDGGDGDTYLDAQVKVIGFADVIQNGEVE